MLQVPPNLSIQQILNQPSGAESTEMCQRQVYKLIHHLELELYKPEDEIIK